MAAVKTPILRSTYSMKARSCLFAGFAGTRLHTRILSGAKTLVSSVRKFLVYTPVSVRHKRRSRIVSNATSKVAKRLGLDIEISETNKVPSPYVFYLKEDKGQVPVYCDLGKDWNEEKIYNAIRSVVYALSFLPEYDNLQLIRSG